MRTCLARLTTLFVTAALACGCTITIGSGSTSFDDNGAAGPGEAPRLPEPTVWRVEPPALTPDQQQRKHEVDQYLAEQYQDYTIVEATQGYSGDIIYWVDSETMPGPHIEPPPLSFTAEDLTPAEGAELARAELDLYPELRGPEGTTPTHRPDFGVYVMGQTDAASLQDFIENYQVPGQPFGQNRLYAGLRLDTANMGASGIINQFHGDVEPGTFSLIEVTVSCEGLHYATTLEQVGAVVSRDRANFFDAKPRLHVEYATRGPGPSGHGIGGWDERQAGFIPFRRRPYGPGAVVTASKAGDVVPASEPGLATQQEHRIDIEQDTAGNWWIAHNGYYLGYYPAKLFDMMNLVGCSAAWYGEVADRTPTDWTWTDMGSGDFAAAGYGYASYVRDPMYRDAFFEPYRPTDQLAFDPNPIVCFSCMLPEDDACYTRSVLTDSMDRIYLGGPGGDAAGCD